MSDHYYSKKPAVKSNIKHIQVNVKDETFKFSVDSGVFSKGGLDFGSRLLIEAFREPDIKGPILDIGCGWGPIGITVAKLIPDRTVHMVDINERSVSLSEENAKLNGAKNVSIYQSDLLENVKEDSFAVAITNPPIRAGKAVVFQLYEQTALALHEKGEIWVVIQKKQGAASTKKKLEQLNFEVTTEVKEKGYFVFHGKKC
ncbi:16S rRNA methyltransferase [Salipaludibacillus neizhouensis]|uniref:16S rRNA methyltransferase n=1 Tax=Salipaludibacillus neizhouensis TaxID=885475 RepID=A0A3A9KKA5_9BACI|nr:class I SAM-dependent methyltransferase [Salipaludibacillus neizhouensis]RKL65316.1 16S rRNA methyltransferase [Salipaludibacillus neizhouensis]